MPRRKGDLLALPGVGPALVEILLNVFDSWEADDAALADKGGSRGGSGSGSGSGEAGRINNGSAVDSGGGGGGGGRACDVDGAGGSDGDAERERKSISSDRTVNGNAVPPR